MRSLGLVQDKFYCYQELSMFEQCKQQAGDKETAICKQYKEPYDKCCLKVKENE